MSDEYNPSDIENLAHSIVTRRMEADPTPLESIPTSNEAGLYALYYSGSYPAYQPLREARGDREKVPLVNE